MSKKLLFILLWIYLIYQISNIYVPESFENVIYFKLVFFSVQVAGSLARFASRIGLGNEAFNFRFIAAGFFERPKTQETYVQTEDIFIEGVGVRLYKSIDSDLKHQGAVMIFFHGGGFFMGNLGSYDYYLFDFVRKLNMKVISVDYRLAPENPFPSQINDCYKVTKYILENPSKFNANLSRILLAGDSAGGTIVAVLTQKFARENLTQPAIQLLIYPLLQLANTNLPSNRQHWSTGITGASQIGLGKFAQWYFGILDNVDEIEEIFNRNEHFGLIRNSKEHKRITSYFNTENIELKYRINESLYKSRNETDFYPKTVPEKSLLKSNKYLSRFFKQLFKPEVSPLFAPESDLKNLPKAYFILLEWDFLKDEGLLYANRLKKLGVDVHIAFYENGCHGIASFDIFKISVSMQNDLIDYLRINL